MAGLALPPPPMEKIEQLRQFYRIHDVTLIDEATLILSEHAIEDVAEALRAKYSMLPPGWRTIKITGRLSALGALGSPKESFSAVARPSLASKGSAFNFQDVGATLPSEINEMDVSSDGYSGNMVVNEICDTERQFYTKITLLRDRYVDALYEVIGGKAGKEAAAALSLSLEQANQVFSPLAEVLRFSRALLDKLEVVSLCRTRPRSGRARAYFVAEAFLAVEPKLKAYAPVITTYKSSLEVIAEASKKTKTSAKYMNFLQWWEKISESSELLKGQRLDAVLIMPMQRIPRYEMLLKELLKQCEDESALPIIEQALESFSNAAKEINEAVRTHEKMTKFFGDELKPVRATKTKDGIKNEYEVSLPNKFT